MKNKCAVSHQITIEPPRFLSDSPLSSAVFFTPDLDCTARFPEDFVQEPGNNSCLRTTITKTRGLPSLLSGLWTICESSECLGQAEVHDRSAHEDCREDGHTIPSGGAETAALHLGLQCRGRRRKRARSPRSEVGRAVGHVKHGRSSAGRRSRCAPTAPRPGKRATTASA